MIKRLMYRFFGSDSFHIVHRYDITTGIVGELYNSNGTFATLVLSNLKPDVEYRLKSNQFEYDEFTNRLRNKLKLDPMNRIDLPRNMRVSVSDRRTQCLAY